MKTSEGGRRRSRGHDGGIGNGSEGRDAWQLTFAFGLDEFDLGVGEAREDLKAELINER